MSKNYTFGYTFADLAVGDCFYVLMESEIPPGFTLSTAFLKQSESTAQAEAAAGGGVVRVMPATRVYVHARSPEAPDAGGRR